MSDVNETRIRRQIAQRLSLRGPQELALGILGDVLTHMMTHQAHHRGQISAVITRLGYSSLEMDYLYYKRQIDAYRTEVSATP